MTTKQEQAKAAIQIVLAVGDAIRELSEVSSGELYANLMGKLTFHQYEQVIHILVDSKMITNHGHLLRWVGPAK